MIVSSPLRYPGGKSAMAGLLAEIRRANGLGGRAIGEPFAGGAGAALTLLFSEQTPEVFINDADPAIADFWWAITSKSAAFSALLRSTRVNMAEWRRQRAIYRRKGKGGRLKRGFSAFYLNRCNRSGIIMNGGPIGGVKQDGEWKLNARFNKEELRRRCNKLAEYEGRVHASGMDGLAFMEQHDAPSMFFFVDPPYYDKGKTLYLNALDDDYHGALAARLRTMKKAAWVLTYDDCPQIRKFYDSWAQIRPFSLGYAAAERRSGREILIVPKGIRLPSKQRSEAIKW